MKNKKYAKSVETYMTPIDSSKYVWHGISMLRDIQCNTRKGNARNTQLDRKNAGKLGIKQNYYSYLNTVLDKKFSWLVKKSKNLVAFLGLF